jgi:hypothetical protein
VSAALLPSNICSIRALTFDGKDDGGGLSGRACIASTKGGIAAATKSPQGVRFLSCRAAAAFALPSQLEHLGHWPFQP